MTKATTNTGEPHILTKAETQKLVDRLMKQPKTAATVTRIKALQEEIRKAKQK